MKYYIAYGSNLNKGQMAYRCPGANAVGTGTLEGWRLTFRGSPGASFATVEPCEGHSVPVGIWEIDREHEASLDIYEGWPDLYYKTDVTVVTPGGDVTGMIYIMNEGREIACPSLSYCRTVSDGYDDFGIDKAVLAEALSLCARQ